MKPTFDPHAHMVVAKRACSAATWSFATHQAANGRAYINYAVQVLTRREVRYVSSSLPRDAGGSLAS